MSKVFDNLLLLGRPASGKSEFIDFMKNVSEDVRLKKYGIGSFKELDDFPWIWEKCREDDIWEAAGYPRLYSRRDPNACLDADPQKGPRLFDFLIQRINYEYEKNFHSNSNFFSKQTLLIEFSRGGKEAYTKALNNISTEILENARLLFVFVSYEESCRRNEARFQEKLRHSILAHKVPEYVLENFYRTHDWLELTHNEPYGVLKIQGISIPFVTMNNEPELTDPVLLDERYGKALNQLRCL